LNFTAYGGAKRLLLPPEKVANPGFNPTVFFAGCAVAPITAIISTPEHVIKTQMQLDSVASSGSTKFNGSSLDCVKQLLSSSNKQGIRNLYKGYLINTYREYAGRASEP